MQRKVLYRASLVKSGSAVKRYCACVMLMPLYTPSAFAQHFRKSGILIVADSTTSSSLMGASNATDPTRIEMMMNCWGGRGCLLSIIQ